MSTVVEAARRTNPITESIAFLIQVLIAISFEVADDLGRGLFAQHGTVQGNTNALNIAAFEAQHGFWVEPAWQSFFLQTHRALGLTLTWATSERLMNTVYVGGHVFVTLTVALWVYVYHRSVFRFARNTVMLTNLYALIIYENFPVAPPRLTQGLIFNHHPFMFQDTVFGVVSASGKLLGSQAGYNEFSAMPSVHMGWALIVGTALFTLARPVAIRLLGIVYPGLMLVAVVVTGNHYLLDAAAAVGVVGAAAGTALLFERYAPLFRSPLRTRSLCHQP